MLIIYTLSNCDTCRKAMKWLSARGVAFEEKAIRETPPTAAELRAMLTHQNDDVKRLFNTSGQRFRETGLKDKLPKLSTEAAIALLAADGHLVKRPFLIGPGVGLVGFSETAWREKLG